jgi:hypothetical protein
MVTCPRCGHDAEYLADDTFSLIRCEFCGDDIDPANLTLREDLEGTIHRLFRVSATQQGVADNAQAA